MKNKIVPHLWFDKTAKEATAFYTALLPNSNVKNITTITDTPSGNCDLVSFTLAGDDFKAMNAGPYFNLNPSISLFVTFDLEDQLEKLWLDLINGGNALMALDSYPWADKYGWVQDKYGLSWQLSMSAHHKTNQKITPMMLFTQDKAGQAEEAIRFYSDIFPDANTEILMPYGKADGDKEGLIKHARFSLCGQNFMAMDSSGPHGFIFNEAFSFVVNCDTQKEIDFYWEKLSAVPESEQCGWLKDKYGLSWQIVPSVMNEMMESGNKEKVAQVTQAFLTMKKLNIAALEQAFSQ